MPARRGALDAAGDTAAILRLHIAGIGAAATLVFGWLLTGHLLAVAAAASLVDWLLINLLNRLTDLDEDAENAIRATGRVRRWRRPLSAAWIAALAGSLAATWALAPALLPWRVAVQAVGVAYSVPLLPLPGGRRRLKAIYAVKNLASSLLFVATVFAYPVALAGLAHPGGAAAALLLALYFVPFELTYEILYDLRDLPGDRLAGVPTFPVVHGERGARRIIDALLLASLLPLAAGTAAGLLGLRELLLAAAPALQWVRYRRLLARRALDAAACIRLTHLGTALLLAYLAGTHLWAAAGLPANVYLR